MDHIDLYNISFLCTLSNYFIIFKALLFNHLLSLHHSLDHLFLHSPYFVGFYYFTILQVFYSTHCKNFYMLTTFFYIICFFFTIFFLIIMIIIKKSLISLIKNDIKDIQASFIFFFLFQSTFLYIFHEKYDCNLLLKMAKLLKIHLYKLHNFAHMILIIYHLIYLLQKHVLILVWCKIVY